MVGGRVAGFGEIRRDWCGRVQSHDADAEFRDSYYCRPAVLNKPKIPLHGMSLI